MVDHIVVSTARIVTDSHHSLFTIDNLHINLVVPDTVVIHKPFRLVFGLSINQSQLMDIIDCIQVANNLQTSQAVVDTMANRMLQYPLDFGLVIALLMLVKGIIQVTIDLESQIKGIIQAVAVRQ